MRHTQVCHIYSSVLPNFPIFAHYQSRKYGFCHTWSLPLKYFQAAGRKKQTKQQVNTLKSISYIPVDVVQYIPLCRDEQCFFGEGTEALPKPVECFCGSAKKKKGINCQISAACDEFIKKKIKKHFF